MAIGNNNGRSFERTVGIDAYVTAHSQGNLVREIMPLKIGPKNGVITLPPFLSGSTKETVPSHFTLEVVHHKDDKRVIVAQREKGDRYRLSSTTAPFGDLIVHTEPPCEVRIRKVPQKEMEEQDIGDLAIWLDTQMQTRHGSNRADVIRITEDGKVTLHRILLLYLDGRFRLVSEVGWEGELFLRADPSKPYELQSEDQRIVSAYHGHEDVRNILKKYVFVPDYGFPSIEGWLQMLLLPVFRSLVLTTKDLDIWEKSEHFWSKPEPKVAMTEGQGIVEWYAHGTGGTAMGYVKLHKPIVHKGRTIERVQIKHHSIDGPVDAQGLKKLVAGDIVQIHRVVDMDVKNDRHAPLGVVDLVYHYREEGAVPAKEDEVAVA
jgi:hypothetical protein